MALFVSASYLTGLDAKTMARKSIIEGIRGREGQARTEAQTLFDYIGHRPT